MSDQLTVETEEKRRVTIARARGETEREFEKRRYLQANAARYGMENALERWRQYEELILFKYGSVNLEAAWTNHIRRTRRAWQLGFSKNLGRFRRGSRLAALKDGPAPRKQKEAVS